MNIKLLSLLKKLFVVRCLLIVACWLRQLTTTNHQLPTLKSPLMSALILAFAAHSAAAQIGGLNTYEFLNLSPSARVSALGGNLITVRDDDANLALANPSLLNESMHQQLAFSHSFHVAGISHG